MLKALQRIDPTAFKDDDLSENKLHTGTSKTRQGPRFEAWLKTYLDDVATKKSKLTSKLTKGEVAKAITEAKPPADQKDIAGAAGAGSAAGVGGAVDVGPAVVVKGVHGDGRSARDGGSRLVDVHRRTALLVPAFAVRYPQEDQQWRIACILQLIQGP